MSPLEMLAHFATEHGYFKTRGALNVGLVLTRRARDEGLPLDAERQLAEQEGQVRGLSGRAGDAILKEYGVDKSVGTEGGRTNRGSLANMRRYVAFLNNEATRPGFSLPEFEKFWVDQFVARFANQPFKVKREAGASIQAIVRDLIDQAHQRQKDLAGAMIVGTMLQHLVGAKLERAMGDRVAVVHHGANVSDQSGRGGDFDIGDAAIHITVTPSDRLLEKCRRNVEVGIRPVIVTTGKGVTAAEVLAEPHGLSGKLEIHAAEQFIALNINEFGGFEGPQVRDALHDVIDRYNRIIDAHEADPSLRIEW